MKKMAAIIFSLAMVPALASAKTLFVHLNPTSGSATTQTTVHYTLCSDVSIANSTHCSIVSDNQVPVSSSQVAQITIPDGRQYYVIAYQMDSVNGEKIWGPFSTTSPYDNLCNASVDHSSLTFNQNADGSYTCNGMGR